MSEFLNKADELVKRTGCTYEEAKEALQKSEGDLLDALIHIEKAHSKEEKFKSKSEDLYEEIKKIVKEVNATRIIILKDDETLVNVPISAGAVGMVLAPILSLLGLTAAMVTKYKIEIVTKDGEKININKKLEESMDKMKDEFDNIGKNK